MADDQPASLPAEVRQRLGCLFCAVHDAAHGNVTHAVLLLQVILDRIAEQAEGLQDTADRGSEGE